ncbi:hypothetical protein BHM03_00022253 [Ensete ventricosum]|nr:hypothetical protein BHM03_00022253 [Ensete ventricosum]
MAGLRQSIKHFFFSMLIVFLCIIAAQVCVRIRLWVSVANWCFTLASVTVMTFMLAGGFFVQVSSASASAVPFLQRTDNYSLGYRIISSNHNKRRERKKNYSDKHLFIS